MTLPNLFLPGAGKSGTSSLHSYLQLHPDIFMSTPKEPLFFSDPDRYSSSMAEYELLFSGGADRPIRGESSTSYLHFPGVPERIANTITSPRFIFLLRNPVERTISHFRWMTARGGEDRPLREAVSADMDDVPDVKNDVGGNYRYYACESRYAEHIARYRSVFDADQVLLLTSEELRDQPLVTLNLCASFLGVAPFKEVASIWSNTTPPQRRRKLHTLLTGDGADEGWPRTIRRALLPIARMASRRSFVREQHARLVRWTIRDDAGVAADDRTWLRALFDDDVQRLRALSGRGFSEWASDFPLPVGTT
jgi:hypothetical protein